MNKRLTSLIIVSAVMLFYNNCQGYKYGHEESSPSSTSVAAGGPIVTVNPPANNNGGGGTVQPQGIGSGSALEVSALAILKNRCYTCHGLSNMGNVGDVTNPSYLLSSGLCVKGNAAGSSLVQSVSPGGNMPLGSPGIPAAELATLQSYVNANP